MCISCLCYSPDGGVGAYCQIAGGASAFFGGGPSSSTAIPITTQTRTNTPRSAGGDDEGAEDDNAFSSGEPVVQGHSEKEMDKSVDKNKVSAPAKMSADKNMTGKGNVSSVGGHTKSPSSCPPLPCAAPPPRALLSADVTIPSEESDELRSVPPQGVPGCLGGYKVACTGVMGHLMSREDIESLVLQYGGKVLLTGGVGYGRSSCWGVICCGGNMV